MRLNDEALRDLRTAVTNLRRAVEILEARNRRLRCAECDRVADDAAHGWRSYLTDDDPPLVESFCPDCAAVEFGDG